MNSPDRPSDPAAPGVEESLLWRGTPSQWTNLGTYLVCLLLAAGVIGAWWVLPRDGATISGTEFTLPSGPILLAGLAVPFLIAFSRWLLTRSNVYELTSERIQVTRGLLSRHTSELELYRVRDYSVIKPFWLRLINRGNVTLVTSDRTTPELVLRAVPQPDRLKDMIRIHTEKLRQRRGVRDLEVDTQ